MSRSLPSAQICAESEARFEFRRLLEEALQIADEQQMAPELGARLQEIIDLAAQLNAESATPRP